MDLSNWTKKYEYSEKSLIKKLENLSIRAYEQGVRSSNIDALKRTKYWTKAKELLIEYYTKGNTTFLKCPMCNRKINKNIHLHHKKYPRKYFFLPKYCMLVHGYCHVRYHKGYFFESFEI